MAIATYTELANIYEAAMSTGVNRVIANGIANNAANLAEAFTLYIGIIAGLMCVREMEYKTFVAHMLRAGIIAFLMTVEGFNTMIATPAMDTIPAWIAATSNNATGVTAGAQQFNLLSSAVTHQTAAILQQAVGITNIGYRAEAKFDDKIIHLFITIDFWIYEFSRLMMGMLVATVPFVLFLYLFEATRQVPLRLAHKALGILILQLMLSVMIQVVMAGESTFLIHITSGTTGDLDTMLGVMDDIITFFAFSVGLVIFLPAAAAYVGGGIALSVGGAILSRMPSAFNTIRGAAGRAGRAGGRAIARARS